MINQVIVKHYSGISILASPLMMSKGHEIHPEELFKVMTILKNIYPYIIIDAGNNLDNNTVTYMDMSDQIFLVINPNIASLRDARQFMDLERFVVIFQRKDPPDIESIRQEDRDQSWRY